jgi:hypothetical protein
LREDPEFRLTTNGHNEAYLPLKASKVKLITHFYDDFRIIQMIINDFSIIN